MIHPYNLQKFLKLIINNWNETVCTVQKHVKWCQLQQKHISKISQITKNGRRKDDFNCTDLNWQLLKTLKWKWRQREFPTSSFNFIFSYFAKYISKSFCLNFLSRVKLFQFVMQKTPEQCGHNTYQKQKSFQYGMYLQSVTCV